MKQSNSPILYILSHFILWLQASTLAAFPSFFEPDFILLAAFPPFFQPCFILFFLFSIQFCIMEKEIWGLLLTYSV